MGGLPEEGNTGPVVTAPDVPRDVRGRVPFTIEIVDAVPFVSVPGDMPGWFGN